jgi:FlaA1/EpsC-like NDP-sugar epimerase
MKRTMLITGAGGFLGRHLCNKYKDEYNVVGVSRNLDNLQKLKRDLKTIEISPCDISNLYELEKIFVQFKPDVVIHAAANKYIDLSENFPSECVNSNVVGSKNVLDLSIKYQSKKVIGVSTDKASPPVKSMYGLSKAIMEKLFTLSSSEFTQVACVRFGNILWSTGSVLPIWYKAYQDQQKLKFTGNDMTRFFFSVNEAVSVVDFALKNIDITEGKILSYRMKAGKIKDLLDAFCEVYHTEYEAEESRPGERMYESLISETEIEFSELLDDKFILYHINSSRKLENHLSYDFCSENNELYTFDELKEFVAIRDFV